MIKLTKSLIANRVERFLELRKIRNWWSPELWGDVLGLYAVTPIDAPEDFVINTGKLPLDLPDEENWVD